MAMKIASALLMVLPTVAGIFPASAQEKPLFNGRNLDGWEVIGDGQWTVMADGTLLGQRVGDYRKMFAPGGPLATPRDFKSWVDTQSWLYTTRNNFGEFDLHLEYWTSFCALRLINAAGGASTGSATVIPLAHPTFTAPLHPARPSLDWHRHPPPATRCVKQS